MSFFTNKHKRYAFNCSKSDIQRAYQISERKLIEASRSGNVKHLKSAMKQHSKFEYALLYQNTPEYKKSLKRNR